jgi:hypothetical protein
VPKGKPAYVSEKELPLLESAKFWADYLKHTTTLSSGSILLIPTFLEKLFAHPHWKASVVVSLLGLLSSLLGSVGAFTYIAWNVHIEEEGKELGRTAGNFSLYLT